MAKTAKVAAPVKVHEFSGDEYVIPAISPVVIDALTEMLMTDQGMTRPPEKSAALLALIVELHKMKQPFPPRQMVAQHLDCSIFTVDAAISGRSDEGYIIAQETQIESSSKIANRHGIRRRRFYVPSNETISVVERAKRRNKRQDT